MTIVVDHDTGRLIWAAKGHDKKTLEGFFDLLGEERSAHIQLVSCDAQEWISDVVAVRCENATVCLDAFHLVKWVTEALDEVRRETWNEARRAGMRAHARDLKHARYALWKNPEDLTERQEAKLAWVAKVNGRLYRAYLLKEQFSSHRRRQRPQRTEDAHGVAGVGRPLPHPRLRRARPAHPQEPRRHRSRAHPRPVQRAHRVDQHETAAVDRVAYGFKEPEHLIALALLDRGGHCPALPGRAH
jgi:transposase